MRIVALVASGRKDGNTSRIVALLGERLRRLAAQAGEALDLEVMFLSGLHLEACRGCRLCFDQGETSCPIHDDLLPLKGRLSAADGIIAASPVYVDDASGVMKNWIDRMAHLCHRPGFGGKPVLLLATTGGSPTLRTLGTMKTAFTTWGAHVVASNGFRTGALSPKIDLEACYARTLDRAAQRLFGAACGAAPLRPSFRALLTFRIQQAAWRTARPDTLDFTHWRNRGWLERRANYYVPHKASWLKVHLARLVGGAIALFFIQRPGS